MESIILLSAWAILSVHAESLMLRVRYSQRMLILSACALACTESIISQRRTLRRTLRVSACAESIILSASYSHRALRVSLTLRVWYSQHESIILSACAESITLRVSYSQCTLRVWWYSQHKLILSECASARVSYSPRCTLRHTLRVSAWAESIILSASYSQGALRLSLTMRVYGTLTLRVSYSQQLTEAAMKKTTISNCQYCWLTSLVNSTSTAPPIGLPPKGAKFCHTLNILLVGHWCCRVLLRLYFNSSAAGCWSVIGWSVGWLVGWSTVYNKGCGALGAFPPKRKTKKIPFLPQKDTFFWFAVQCLKVPGHWKWIIFPFPTIWFYSTHTTEHITHNI